MIGNVLIWVNLGVRMAKSTSAELAALLEYAHARLDDRVKGMSEHEYRWEPVAGCWSVRSGEDGIDRVDVVRGVVENPPLTTIAWRLWHIADCLRTYSDQAFEGRPHAVSDEWTQSPVAAIAVVDSEWDRFVGYVGRLDREGLGRPLGPAFGQYAEESVHALVLHAVDEMVHHSAEVALLRDLYRTSDRGRAWAGGDAAAD